MRMLVIGLVVAVVVLVAAYLFIPRPNPEPDSTSEISLPVETVTSVTAASATPSAVSTTETSGSAATYQTELTCDQAYENVRRLQELDPLVGLDTVTKVAQCEAERHNGRAPDDPVVVQVVPIDADGGKKSLAFGIVHVKDADALIKACQIGIAVVSQLALEPGTVSMIAEGGSKFTCESYYEAAAKNSGLLIFAPGMVPGVKLVKTVLYQVGLGKTLEEAQKAAKELEQKAVEAGKEAGDLLTSPEVLIAPPIGIPYKIITGCKNKGFKIKCKF